MRANEQKNDKLIQMSKTSLVMGIWVAATTALVLATEAQAQEPVTITDKGTHYEVVLDLESGATHRQIGEAYGRKIKEVVPQFEQLLDSYLAEFSHNWFVNKILIRRVRQVKPQLSQDYKDEIEGIASQLSGGTRNVIGDGKISRDELYEFNLLGDVARLTQCCALAVFNERSATGSTIVGRNFDWPDGKKNQLSQLQSVTTYKNGSRSFTNVGCVGFQGAITAFNRSGVSVSVLDSPTGCKFSAKRRRSFVLDLRQALEQCTTLDEIANSMMDETKRYSFGHSILLADSKLGAVLENNISTGLVERRRGLRFCDSKLQSCANWNLSDAVGCVNCFVLEGNIDNHIDPLDKRDKRPRGTPPADINTPRWNSIKEQITAQGPKVTREGMKSILSFYHPESGGNIHKGDLYNSLTMESVVFEPATFSLDVAFRPRNGVLPRKLQFEHVTLPD